MKTIAAGSIVSAFGKNLGSSLMYFADTDDTGIGVRRWRAQRDGAGYSAGTGIPVP